MAVGGQTQFIYLPLTVASQLGFFKDHDELFWNVTGNGWGFPIDHASATVSLPFAIAQSEVSLDGFTGPQGSYEKNLRSTAQPDGQFEFEALRPLRAKEGLSIVLSWKKGLIAPPTTRETLDYFFTDNRDALVMVAGQLAGTGGRPDTSLTSRSGDTVTGADKRGSIVDGK